MEHCTLTNKKIGTTSFLTMLFCVEPGSLELGEKKGYMKSGDLILCRENIPYKADKKLKIEEILYQKEFFDELFISQLAECRIIYEFFQTEIERPEYLYFSDNEDKEIQTYWNLMKEEIMHEDFHSDKMMHLYIVGLLTILNRKRNEQLVVQNSTMIANNRFGKIMKYMGDHYADCSLQEIAEKFGYNPDYLSVRFQKITGTTFSQKLLMIRLEQSLYLLRTSELTIEEIALEIGFHDKSYFMKKFKEYYGVTPSKYRKEHSLRDRRTL